MSSDWIIDGSLISAKAERIKDIHKRLCAALYVDPSCPTVLIFLTVLMRDLQIHTSTAMPFEETCREFSTNHRQLCGRCQRAARANIKGV